MEFLRRTRQAVRSVEQSLTPFWWPVVACTAALGAAGTLAGLGFGLATYPLTAWAAAVEIGLPSASLGACVGTLLGTIRVIRLRRS